MPLAELLHRVGFDVIPRHGTRHHATQCRQITTNSRTFHPCLHSITGIISQPGACYLIEMQITECRVQLPETSAVSLLGSRLQTRKVIVRESFEGIGITATRATTTIQAAMFFQNSREILLGDSFGRSMSRSPDLPALPLEANPVGRIALVDGRHDRCPTPIPYPKRLAWNWFFASK